jgi:hypothetical protein
MAMKTSLATYHTRSRTALRRFAADNPAHRRIVAQALGLPEVL